MVVFGVTGRYGVGKSTVASYFSDHGFLLVDVDAVGHDVLSDECSIAVMERFGTVSREELRKIVLSDVDKLRILEGILHPVMVKRVRSMVSDAVSSKKNVVIDCALLYTLGLDSLCDTVIGVVGPCRREEGEEFSSLQMDEEEIRSRVDVVVENTSFDDLNESLSSFL